MSYIHDGIGRKTWGKRSYVDMAFTTDDWDFLLFLSIDKFILRKTLFRFMGCASVRAMGSGIKKKEKFFSSKVYFMGIFPLFLFLFSYVIYLWISCVDNGVAVD